MAAWIAASAMPAKPAPTCSKNARRVGPPVDDVWSLVAALEDALAELRKTVPDDPPGAVPDGEPPPEPAPMEDQ